MTSKLHRIDYDATSFRYIYVGLTSLSRHVSTELWHSECVGCTLSFAPFLQVGTIIVTSALTVKARVILTNMFYMRWCTYHSRSYSSSEALMEESDIIEVVNIPL